MKIKCALTVGLMCCLYAVSLQAQDAQNNQNADEPVQAETKKTPTDDQGTPETETVTPPTPEPEPAEVTTAEIVTTDIQSAEPEAEEPEVTEPEEVVTAPEVTEVPEEPEAEVQEEVVAAPETIESLVQEEISTIEPVTTTTPTEPAPVPTPAPAPEEEQEEGIIDTMDIDDNVNWLEVRKYLQDAIVLLEKISTSFTQVSDMRAQYLQKRNQADKQFDQFMKNIGMDMGQLYQKVNDYAARLGEERKDDGDLTVDERALLDTVNKNKASIEQLQQDVASLVTIDASIDDILTTAEQQISVSKNYQNQAWQNFQKMETTPQKAEELYAKIEAAYQNVQQLYAYLNGDLLTYFTNTINTLTTQISSVKSQLGTLKSAGVNIAQKMKNFEDQDEQEDKKLQEQQCEDKTEQAVEDALEQERERVAQQKGFVVRIVYGAWSWISGAVSTVWVYTKGIVSTVVSKITGAKQPSETEGFHAPTDIKATPTDAVETAPPGSSVPTAP